jgi:hypothetical protein
MVETIWIELHAPHSVIEPVSVLARILGCLSVSLVIKSQFGRGRRCKWARQPRSPGM